MVHIQAMAKRQIPGAGATVQALERELRSHVQGLEEVRGLGREGGAGATVPPFGGVSTHATPPRRSPGTFSTLPWAG